MIELTENLLPRDGEAYYVAGVIDPVRSQELTDALLAEVPWQHDEIVMFGKRIVTARQVAWVADEGLSYTYSSVEKRPLAWSPVLKELKLLVETWTSAAFNACLLNLYQDGTEGMGWHSDDEKSIVGESVIASVSLGAERPFRFCHKESGDVVRLTLETGSVLIMKGAIQRCWKHTLPKTKRVTSPRVNLTFRLMRPVVAEESR
ncbi:MAG: alpha-ketoglutarate-dependent dioxygenase AlkB [Verrucomicrobiales bacterium]|jgi:alkylated DNA repair dioxygenase AlkB|nr:alpha-ketoglutarate-dependent dioxygenase AlkB [Verrucomicrobiales bacterium]MDB4772975.1 alpha-ketoglutarate-dependent dioxygenase AlkB [Verrucomicrobiales bacterium]MDF1789571.1 alpha-ketoglutarate-dependent dioxygenase AlkB [Verrucomicrobiales bacterium]